MGRKSWATEARRGPGEAKGGREVGSGARGGSGLRREATDTMAVKTRWRVSRKRRGPGCVSGAVCEESRHDGWRGGGWRPGTRSANRRRPGLRGKEALAAGSERAKTTNSLLQPATTKRMRVDRELTGAGSRGPAKESDKAVFLPNAAMEQGGAPRGGSSVSGLPLELLDAVSLSGRAGNRALGRDGGVWTTHRSLDGDGKWRTGEPQSD